MNSVQVIGNVTRDVETKTVGDNTVTKFGVAVNNPFNKEKVTFVDVEVWGKQTEFVSQYVKKGNSVGLTAELAMDSWDDKETGKRRSKLFLKASRVDLLTRKGDNSSESPEETVVPMNEEKVPF